MARKPKNRKVDTIEAAAILGIAEVTLRKWRKRNYGPPYYRHGPGKGRIFYLTDDVIRWREMIVQSGGGTGEPSSAAQEKQRD